ncbi:MAG: HesB/IscA family protein [Alphaproteobacteria bacterium]
MNIATTAKPQAITLTAAAIARVKALMANADSGILGLRIGVKTKGCSGLSYVVEYAKEEKKFEEVIEDQGVKIFIEPSALLFLVGSVMDYQEDKLQAGFTFTNPNEKGRCGCGESFTI